MTSLFRLTLIAAVAAAGFAIPALAQSFDPEAGTGNVLPSYYGTDGVLHAGMTAPLSDQIAIRQSGLHTHALASASPRNNKTALHHRGIRAFRSGMGEVGSRKSFSLSVDDSVIWNDALALDLRE